MDNAGIVSTGGDMTVAGSFTVAGGDASISGSLTVNGPSIQPGGSGNGVLQGLGTTATLYVADSTLSNYKPLVVSANPSLQGLMIVRATISVAGALIRGEGLTATLNSTGVYTLTFAGFGFLDVPVCTVSLVNGSGASTVVTDTTTSTSIVIRTFNGVTPVSSSFSIICIGQRV